MRSAPSVAVCLTALFLAGCAATSPAPSETAPRGLRIDNQAPAALLAPGESARIAEQIPAQYRGPVIAAEALGAVISRHEQLAAAAARALTAAHAPALPGKPAGWLGERVGGRLSVLFLTRAKEGVVVAAEATAGAKPGAPSLRRLRSPRALTPQEVNLWRARQMAFSARITACAKQYNPVVVPIHAAGTDQIYVYLLPASPDPARIFLGGYYRIAMSAKGDRVLDTHAFTHSCLVLRRRRATVAAYVTEVKSGTPTAPQVYASLHYGLPVYVATTDNGLVWKVTKGTVNLVRSAAGS